MRVKSVRDAIDLFENLDLSDKLYTEESFSKMVETKIDEFDGSYMETLLYLSEKMNISFETISSLLTPQLKEEIEYEARTKNMMLEKSNVALRFE